MAWVFHRYLKELEEPRRAVYGAAEDDARAARRGLWSEREPMPPWEWRALKRNRERSALP